MKHGIKPYQRSTFSKKIKGLLFVNTISAKFVSEEKEFEKYYFDKNINVYSDKLAKLAVRCNENASGRVIDRISRIFPSIFIDEVQDLNGWDLEIIKLLSQSNANIILVGDPRQVTYTTHPDSKYSQYKEGRIEQFITKECKQSDWTIDKTTLNLSHRNNVQICNFSSLLYPSLPQIQPCNCVQCRSNQPEHLGIYIVNPAHVDSYISKYKPIVMRYSKSTGSEWNFGRAKGLGFDRILIYPTKDFVNFLKTGNLTKTVKGEIKKAFDIAKFYVAITRARHSVGIVCEHSENDNFIELVQKYTIK